MTAAFFGCLLRWGIVNVTKHPNRRQHRVMFMPAGASWRVSPEASDLVATQRKEGVSAFTSASSASLASCSKTDKNVCVADTSRTRQFTGFRFRLLTRSSLKLRSSPSQTSSITDLRPLTERKHASTGNFRPGGTSTNPTCLGLQHHREASAGLGCSTARTRDRRGGRWLCFAGLLLSHFFHAVKPRSSDPAAVCALG